MRVPTDDYGRAPKVPDPPPNRITVSAGTAFKIGFYGAIGFAVATIAIWVIVIALFAGAIGSLLHR
jgi:hypothetical protein